MQNACVVECVPNTLPLIDFSTSLALQIFTFSLYISLRNNKLSKLQSGVFSGSSIFTLRAGGNPFLSVSQAAYELEMIFSDARITRKWTTIYVNARWPPSGPLAICALFFSFAHEVLAFAWSLKGNPPRLVRSVQHLKSQLRLASSKDAS